MSKNDPGVEFIPGRSENILRHLHKCNNQTESMRQNARQECIHRGWLSGTPSRPQARHQTFAEMSDSPDTGLPGLALDSFMSAGANAPMLAPPTQPLIQLPNRSLLFQSNMPSPLLIDTSAPQSRAASPAVSLAPSDASSYRSKRPRTLTRNSSFRNESQLNSPVSAVWTSGHQARFNSRVARLTAACGFAFQWVNNPEWIAFCNEFVPSASHIDRRSLANKYIPAEVKKFRDAAISRSKGLEATIQCDGWSGINFHHYLAFMVTTASREVSQSPFIVWMMASHSISLFNTGSQCPSARYIIRAQNSREPLEGTNGGERGAGEGLGLCYCRYHL
jgi:hypothetical protein